MKNAALKETATASPKAGKIRAINQGSRYDITGNLRRIEREIERGEHGDVGDVVILFTEKCDNSSPAVHMRHLGTGSVADVHWMVSTAKSRVEPR